MDASGFPLTLAWRSSNRYSLSGCGMVVNSFPEKSHMFREKSSLPPFRTQEELSQHLEDEVRRQMAKKSIKMGFWGSISVDPNEMYVSKNQAERSIRVLEECYPALRARRIERKMQSDIPREGQVRSTPGKKRL